MSKMAPETLAEATEGMETDDVAYVFEAYPTMFLAKSFLKWTPLIVL